MTEVLFIVEEDNNGFHARAVGASITTQACTRHELVRKVREAVRCHFNGQGDAPKLAHLHYVRDETIPIEDEARRNEERYPLRGKQPYRYDNPDEPAAPEEDWEVYKK